MLKKKNTAAPTLDERLASSAATQEAALSVFEQAAKDLDAAKADADDVAFLASEEIDRMLALRDEANARSASAATAASQIRSLIGGSL